MKCRKTISIEAPLTALGAGTVEMFFNAHGYVCFSPAALWEPSLQFTELLRGGSRLGLRQRCTQLRHNFVAHCDLDGRPGSLRTCRTSCESRLRASLMESFMNKVYKDVQIESMQMTSMSQRTATN